MGCVGVDLKRYENMLYRESKINYDISYRAGEHCITVHKCIARKIGKGIKTNEMSRGDAENFSGPLPLYFLMG